MSTHPKTAYKRVLLKLSGEALQGAEREAQAGIIAARIAQAGASAGPAASVDGDRA